LSAEEVEKRQKRLRQEGVISSMTSLGNEKLSPTSHDYLYQQSFLTPQQLPPEELTSSSASSSSSFQDHDRGMGCMDGSLRLSDEAMDTAISEGKSNVSSIYRNILMSNYII
jgi:hypothetical protein